MGSGFLPDGVFNPFDSIFPNNEWLADVALVSHVNEQNKKNNNEEDKYVRRECEDEWCD